MRQIEEIFTNYVCDQNLRHIDVYFTDTEEGKTVAVICLDTHKVIWRDRDFFTDEAVKEAIAEVLKEIEGKEVVKYTLSDLKKAFDYGRCYPQEVISSSVAEFEVIHLPVILKS